MTKHDADCMRRKPQNESWCTCGLSDADVAQAYRTASVNAEYDKGYADGENSEYATRVSMIDCQTDLPDGSSLGELIAAYRERGGALDYLAEFFADDLVALRQQRIHSFNPPAAFVDRVVAKMVEDGASVESARADLCDLWPDCRALDDVGRTV